jgi:hypothetical protein
MRLLYAEHLHCHRCTDHFCRLTEQRNSVQYEIHTFVFSPSGVRKWTRTKWRVTWHRWQNRIVWNTQTEEREDFSVVGTYGLSYTDPVKGQIGWFPNMPKDLHVQGSRQFLTGLTPRKWAVATMRRFHYTLMQFLALCKEDVQLSTASVV